MKNYILEAIVVRSVISTVGKVSQVVLSYKSFNEVRKLRGGEKQNSAQGIVWKFVDANGVAVWRQFTDEGKSMFWMLTKDAKACTVTREDEESELPSAGF
jgi:hypothetical protein